MPRVAFTAKTRKYLGYAEGGSPAAIFREAGLDPKIIGYKRVERCIARWKAENAEKAAETAVENSENQGE